MFNLAYIIKYYAVPTFLIFGTVIGAQVLPIWGSSGNATYSIIGNQFAWTCVLSLVLWALISLWVPAKEFIGPRPTIGCPAKYSANGLQFFVVSCIAFGAALYFNSELAYAIWNNFSQILAASNILAIVLCIYLFILGKYFPQNDEQLESKPLLYEFYTGMELNRRAFGTDVKQLVICRYGLLSWQLLSLALFVCSITKDGFNMAYFVLILQQTVYLGKFYWWETGYFTTLDITYDRTGYYLCWGCMVWIPSFFTYNSYYFLYHPPVISNEFSVAVFIGGVVFTFLTYRVDWEKQNFRKQSGKCMLWGKPATYIEASYQSSKGTVYTNLLTSGFWGQARHCNYTFELVAALCYCLPGYGLGIDPFYYFIFLFVLILHRLYRDEEKCSVKYGLAWNKYCKQVPHRLIPYIF